MLKGEGEAIVMVAKEVVYENGVFKPLEPVELKEGEKARIEIKRENKINFSFF